MGPKQSNAQVSQPPTDPHGSMCTSGPHTPTKTHTQQAGTHVGPWPTWNYSLYVTDTLVYKGYVTDTLVYRLVPIWGCGLPGSIAWMSLIHLCTRGMSTINLCTRPSDHRYRITCQHKAPFPGSW